MFKNILEKFQQFLQEQKPVQEKYISFYADWVSKFLTYSNNHQNYDNNLTIEKFLNHLDKQNNIEEWQVKQAKKALHLYFECFLKNNKAGDRSDHPQIESRQLTLSQVLKEMREAIRLKHYSYRTEQSYIDWAKKFYNYIKDTKNKDIDPQDFDTDDLKAFLSYLAIRKQVSSSTQNQAFNALLFLFRNVLKINTENLGKTVRAKRGPKLPVVLSVKEVQKLFQQVNGKKLLILQLLYGSGLRLMETARLRIKDVDFEYNKIFVRSGKGDKDRSTILPKYLKDKLFLHLQEVKVLHNISTYYYFLSYK